MRMFGRPTSLHNLLKLANFAADNFDPLTHMPVLGSSNSAANGDPMSKIWTFGDTII